VKGWRGHIAFQALAARSGWRRIAAVSGTIHERGQSLTLDAIKGRIGGGEATANIEARQDTTASR